jgi:hypothetical protein
VPDPENRPAVAREEGEGGKSAGRGAWVRRGKGAGLGVPPPGGELWGIWRGGRRLRGDAREEAGGGGCRGNIGRVQSGRGRLLTPKIGTGKRLTCGPSLVGEYHSARCFPQSIR